MKIKCYVGEWEFKPNGVNDTPLKFIHPKNFKKEIKELTKDIWTNNPYIVGQFNYEDVFICNKDTIKPLSEHPNYEKQKDLFDAGEFWSIVGENW